MQKARKAQEMVTTSCRRHGERVKAYVVTPRIGNPWKRCAECAGEAVMRHKKSRRRFPDAPTGGIFRGQRTTAGIKTTPYHFPIAEYVLGFIKERHASVGVTQSLLLNQVIVAGIRALFDPVFPELPA
jgi:hypothetical protein